MTASGVVESLAGVGYLLMLIGSLAVAMGGCGWLVLLPRRSDELGHSPMDFIREGDGYTASALFCLRYALPLGAVVAAGGLILMGVSVLVRPAVRGVAAPLVAWLLVALPLVVTAIAVLGLLRLVRMARARSTGA